MPTDDKRGNWMIPLRTLHAPAPAAWHARQPVRQRTWKANMSIIRDIALIVGSLRKDSLNRKLAHALIELAPPSLKLEIVEIGTLPVYNPDYDEAGAPAPYAAFRERMRNAQGVLFVTPEYNRSVPAPLKNAIDVGSRPYGKS